MIVEEVFMNFKVEVPEGIYLKDPETSTLGKRIIKYSIKLISEQGIEQFNFKKLGAEVGSNESSVYRYFESKHHLLMYLTSWYWVWVEYRMVLETYALKTPKEKLSTCIKVLTRITECDTKFEHIDETLLNKIIINENSKAYLTCNVDTENEEGFFMPFKRVVKRLAKIIKAYDPTYKYPLNLANTIIEGTLQQRFFQAHFKTITNCNTDSAITDFYTHLTFNTLLHGE